MARIAIITSQAFSLINFRGPLIREMVRRGHEVAAIAPDHSISTEEGLRLLGAEPINAWISRAGRNPVSDLYSQIVLTKQVWNIRADHIFTYGMKPVIYGSIAARICKIPHRTALIEGLGYSFSEETSSLSRSAISFAVRILLRRTLEHYHSLFYLNGRDREDLLELNPSIRESLVHISGIGVDLDEYKATVPSTAEAMTFSLFARMVKSKGIGEFVRAAQLVHSDYPSTRFILIGGPDSNPDSFSSNQLEEWHNQGVVEWVDHVDDVKPWIEQTSVVVQPSYYREGLSRILQEAAAMGRASITTNWPGCREAIEDGKTGILVEPKNVNELASAMIKFIERPDMVLEMGARARMLAERKFDITQINEAILQEMNL